MFQCKECGKDITPEQAKETFEEFEIAMCKACVEKMLNQNDNDVRGSEDEATTPPEHETPASSSSESKDDKSIVPAKKTTAPARRDSDNRQISDRGVNDNWRIPRTEQNQTGILQARNTQKRNFRFPRVS